MILISVARLGAHLIVPLVTNEYGDQSAHMRDMIRADSISSIRRKCFAATELNASVQVFGLVPVS
jgi:hypothetical protein